VTVSSNWSGYAVTGTNDATGAPVAYTSVTGTWTVKPAVCGPSAAGFASAFWVGIGGYLPSSQELEQIGTDADCDDSGKPVYYAWYEIVPANAVNLDPLTHRVYPGNVITTSVNITGQHTVELQITNRTRHWHFTKFIQVGQVDTSSAEWIAEAPSLCSRNSCEILPLANFGSMSFANVAATGDGTNGTIGAPTWTSTSIQLVPKAGRAILPGPDKPAAKQGFGSFASTSGATPATPTPDGSNFAVNWVAKAHVSTTP
jgi:Peptidase A4 family